MGQGRERTQGSLWSGLVGVKERRNQESELKTAVTQESMLDVPKVGTMILSVIDCML